MARICKRSRASWLALAGALLAGCEETCPVLERCDIRDSGCQRHTSKVAACLAGDQGAQPAVRVVDAESFVDEQVAGAEETADQRDVRRGLSLLTLMPGAQDPGEAERASWSFVAAFYDTETAEVTVLSRGWDDASSVTLLLHELVHAIQYQRPEVAAVEETVGTYDAALAWSGMIEGEATLYQDLARLEAFGFDPRDVRWRAAFDAFRSRGWDAALASDDPLRRSRAFFPYAFGGAYMNQAWQHGGSAAVRAVYAEPPLSSRQVLAGYGAEPPAPGLAWREGLEAQARPVLPPEYEPVTTLELGAWLFDLFQARRLPLDGASAWLGSGALLGDVLSVFREPASGDVSVFWRLRFDSSERAAELVALLAALPSFAALGHTQLDRDVVIAIGTQGAPSSAFLQGLSWAPLEERAPEENLPAARVLCFMPGLL